MPGADTRQAEAEADPSAADLRAGNSEGTVQRSGDRLRVTAQLTSARDGLALWSTTYERSARDLFAVQDEITRDLVRAFARHEVPGPLMR